MFSGPHPVLSFVHLPLSTVYFCFSLLELALDVALNQQRIHAWHPILHPTWVIIALFYLGVILVPVGFKIDDIQKNVVEEKIVYDQYTPNYDVNQTICGIGDNFNAGLICDVTFTAPKDMAPPILIHYAIDNFHQNHRSYYRSKDPYQLLGQVGNQDPIAANDCEPLNKLGNTTLNPCGLIANTFFNDYFELISGTDINNQPLEMIETGIAWQSDLEYLFAQPSGFNYSLCKPDECNALCCNAGDSCIDGLPYVDSNGNCYRFYYPNDNTTQYLYETYPDIISPIEGVTNEHFIVWMRIATQPSFRKLYGWIDQPIAAGTVLTFRIHSNYVVTRFRGSKTLLLGTTSVFGGRNPYLAPVFLWSGVFCLVAGALFTLKQIIRPRKLADPAYLHFKED